MINQHILNVSLHAIHIPYDVFQKLPPSDTPSVPPDLEVGGENRKWAPEFFVNFLNRAVENSNANLIGIVTYHLLTMEVELNVEWEGKGQTDWTVLITIWVISCIFI